MEPSFDKSGYPTEATLRAIELWEPNDIPGCFKLLESAWHENGLLTVQQLDDEEQYLFVTGGWSGNEDLISALKKNLPIWGQTWESSSRGGRYVFLVPKPEQKPQVCISEDGPDAVAGFIVMVGNISNGFQCFSGPNGLWEDHEEALKYAEQHDQWEIIPVYEA